MKPIINSRHGLPLIIFPGKVTQSGTLWNPANCIVCSQHGAGSCRAPLGSGEPRVPRPNNWSLQRGTGRLWGRNPLPRPPCHQRCSWIQALTAGWSSSFRCGQPAQQPRQKIRRTCQAIWVSEGSVWMLLFGNCFVFICLFKKKKNYLFSSLEKKGRKNFGWKNPSPWPNSGTRRGMWW